MNRFDAWDVAGVCDLLCYLKDEWIVKYDSSDNMFKLLFQYSLNPNRWPRCLSLCDLLLCLLALAMLLVTTVLLVCPFF